MKTIQGKEFDENVKLNWESAKIHLNKQAKEGQRKKEMREFKDYCRLLFGKDWRFHYLKKWKQYRQGRCKHEDLRKA